MGLAFSALYVVGAAGLWGAEPGLADLTAILAFLAIALIGAEYTRVFTNAALPALGGRDEIGRISGSGWALGYWGGLAILALVLGLIAPVPGSERTVIDLEPILGLDPERGEGARAVGPLSALWYIVFVVPYFLWTPDAPRRPRLERGRHGVAGSEAHPCLAAVPGQLPGLSRIVDVLPRRARRDVRLRRHLRGRRAGLGNVRDRPVRGVGPARRGTTAGRGVSRRRASR